MSSFLIVGQPRSGTNSVVAMLQEKYSVEDFVYYNKANGISKWLESENTVAKMHTIREYNQYKDHINDIVDKVDCVYFTSTRKNIVDHFISLLCASLTRSDNHNLLTDPTYPIDVNVSLEYLNFFISDYYSLNEYIEEYKNYDWKQTIEVDVFSEFTEHKSTYSQNFNDSFFERTDIIKDYLNELYSN